MKLLPITIGFGDLLRRILLFEKVHPVTQVSAALGITVRNFSARLRNGARFSPDDVSKLLQLISDERLRGWLFSGSGLILVKHPVMPPDSGEMSLLQHTAACATEAMSAIFELADAVELSMLGGQQIASIDLHLDRAQSGLTSIKLHLAPQSLAPAGAADGGSREDFAALIRRVLMTEKGVRPQELADALGLRYSALHARMSGRVEFGPAELRQLFRMFPVPQLADYLLTGTPYTAILRPAIVDTRLDYSPVRTGLMALRDVVTVLQTLLAGEDRPGRSLRETLDLHLNEAIRQMATLRWNMTHISRHNAPQVPAIGLRALKAM